MSEYIERDKVLEIIADNYKDLCATYDDVSLAGLEDVNFEIKNLPAADVAPAVHGHWKKCKPDALIWWECSVCGVPHYLDEPRDVFYCPYCGAKMDESEDNNNGCT